MTVLDDTIARFTSDPAAGRIAPAVTATLTDGRTRISAGSFTFDCDLPPAIGGGNQAPSPTAYLLGALAGCAVSFIASTLAPRFDVVINGISATARCTSDLAGLLGVAGADPALNGLAIDIRFESPSPADRQEALRNAWRERCPVLLSLLRTNEVEVRFSN